MSKYAQEIRKTWALLQVQCLHFLQPYNVYNTVNNYTSIIWFINTFLPRYLRRLMLIRNMLAPCLWYLDKHLFNQSEDIFRVCIEWSMNMKWHRSAHRILITTHFPPKYYSTNLLIAIRRSWMFCLLLWEHSSHWMKLDYHIKVIHLVVKGFSRWLLFCFTNATIETG